ncbi:hypothetical protein NKJ72_24335 [Mesorhizobium sp. M0045]|uniref:hypothetical protein n=1 Tax=Mesorhizobium sp. M0045 TaxID=2956857 RepID=UPI00333AD507
MSDDDTTNNPPPVTMSAAYNKAMAENRPIHLSVKDVDVLVSTVLTLQSAVFRLISAQLFHQQDPEKTRTYAVSAEQAATNSNKLILAFLKRLDESVRAEEAKQ